MYSVVGCPDCSAFKIVEDRPETTRCPRCGRQTKFEKLRTFYQTDELDAAREIRARMLAERSGHGEAYAELGGFTELATQTDEAGMSGEEYLAEEGFDTETIAEAGERAMSGTRGADTNKSRKERVLGALREMDRPTEQEIVERVGDSGVPAEYVRDALDKLAQKGEVTENGGKYRLL
jgi:hypothetical protein